MPERPDNQVIAEIEAKSCRILFIVRHQVFDINDVAYRESKIGDLQGFSGCLPTWCVPLRPAARCERGSRGRRPGDKGRYLTVRSYLGSDGRKARAVSLQAALGIGILVGSEMDSGFSGG